MLQSLDEFTCYKTYQALRLHFQGKMDFFKYGTVGKVRPSTYAGRKDRYFFQKLAKKYKRNDLIKLLVANFVYSDASWVGDVLNENAEDIYASWQQRNQSLTYQFEQDCGRIAEYLESKELDFTDLFAPSSAGFPAIVDVYYANAVSLESLIILNSCVSLRQTSGSLIKFRDLLKTEFSLVPCGSDSLYNIMVRYEPFLKIDRTKIQAIIARKFK